MLSGLGAYAAIRFLVRYLRTRSLIPFGLYCLAAGLASVVYLIRGHDIDRAIAWFGRHGAKAVLIGRVLPVIRTFISLPAGIAEMPAVRFGLYTAIGCTPWTGALAWAGYAVGKNWQSIANGFHGPTYIIAAVVLLAVVVLLWRYRRRRRAGESGESRPAERESRPAEHSRRPGTHRRLSQYGGVIDVIPAFPGARAPFGIPAPRDSAVDPGCCWALIGRVTAHPFGMKFGGAAGADAG